MAEKTVEEKLDAIFDSITKRMDAEAEERRADRARLDSVCTKMDAAEEERKADKARKDADEMTAADKARKDAAEKEEKERADAARKDAEDKEAEKVRADAARAGSDGDLRKKIAELEARIPAQLSADDRPKFAAIQMEAEAVYQAFGDSAGAPSWLNGETQDEYRLRLASKFKTHSKAWKEVNLAGVQGPTLQNVVTQIYADAMVEARNPTQFEEGAALQEYYTPDQTGRKIRKFRGPPGACWDQFKIPPRAVAVLNTKFN